MKELKKQKQKSLLYASDLSDFRLEKMTASFPSAERTRRVKKEFEKEIRSCFIKNLTLLFGKEISVHFPKKVLREMRKGFCPQGYSIHHQTPRCIGGQNYNKAAFAKMVKNLPEEEKKIFSESRLKNKIDRLLDVSAIMEEKGISKTAAWQEAQNRFYRLFSGYLVLMRNSRHMNLHQHAFDFQIQAALDSKERDKQTPVQVWIPKTKALFGLLYPEPDKKQQFASYKKEIETLRQQNVAGRGIL